MAMISTNCLLRGLQAHRPIWPNYYWQQVILPNHLEIRYCCCCHADHADHDDAAAADDARGLCAADDVVVVAVVALNRFALSGVVGHRRRRSTTQTRLAAAVKSREASFRRLPVRIGEVSFPRALCCHATHTHARTHSQTRSTRDSTERTKFLRGGCFGTEAAPEYSRRKTMKTKKPKPIHYHRASLIMCWRLSSSCVVLVVA